MKRKSDIQDALSEKLTEVLIVEDTEKRFSVRLIGQRIVGLQKNIFAYRKAQNKV